jgi:hypothetical protein
MTTSRHEFPLSQDAPNSGAVTVMMGMPSGAEATGYLLVPIRKGAGFHPLSRPTAWQLIICAGTGTDWTTQVGNALALRHLWNYRAIAPLT